MSTVFYRWGAGKDESRVTFDGTHISVFDFKREVILNNRMGNGKDFDLGVFDNVTGEGMSFWSAALYLDEENSAWQGWYDCSDGMYSVSLISISLCPRSPA